jgi:hypothetical protein
MILVKSPNLEVSLAQLAMGVDVQPRQPGSNSHGYEFRFLLFIYFKLAVGVFPTAFLSKKIPKFSGTLNS